MTKWTKSGGKSHFSLSFLSSTVNDIRRQIIWSEHTQLYQNDQKECQILQSSLLTPEAMLNKKYMFSGIHSISSIKKFKNVELFFDHLLWSLFQSSIQKGN